MSAGKPLIGAKLKFILSSVLTKQSSLRLNALETPPKNKSRKMPYSDEELSHIYERTDGHCHICRKKLSFINYGCFGSKGAWEVEHSNAKARGGTDYKRNLYPACIPCNRQKRDGTTRTARGQHGFKHAPLSKAKKREVRGNNAVLLGIVGGLAGSIVGPWGVAGGAALGVKLGHDLDPEKD